jgi:phosphoglycolate phosphatase
MAIQAIMIDLDGTLVHTLGDFAAAINRMLGDMDLPLATTEVVAHAVGQGSEHLIRSVLDHQLGLPGQQRCAGRSVDNLYEPAWQRYQHHYARLNGQHSEVYPGALEALQSWRSMGLPMACLTNKPVAFANDLLQAKGLHGFFRWVFGGDSFARKKPDPLPLLETCRALGSEPVRTLMVGDSRNDAQAADAAGCPLVLVSYCYNHGEPIHAVPALAHVDNCQHIHDGQYWVWMRPTPMAE